MSRTAELPTLTVEERDRRWAATRELLAQHDLAGRFIVGVTGPFVAQPYIANTSGGTVLFLADSEPVWLGGAFETSRFFEDRRRGVKPWIADTRFVEDPFRTMVEIAKERGLGGMRFGVLGQTELPIMVGGSMPHAMGEQFVRAVAGEFELVDVTREFGTLTVVRSENELELVRHAARANEAAVKALYETVRVGANESELYAAVINQLALAGARATEPQLLLTVEPAVMDFMGGPHWFFPQRQRHLLGPGDVVQAEIFCWYGGLDSQAQTTITIGEPHEEQRILGDVARRAYEAALAEIKPGVRFVQVWEAMRAVILEAGCWSASPLLHTLSPFTTSGNFTGDGGRPGRTRRAQDSRLRPRQ
ncbi:M24 family metallopeptidase [Arthrobacter sp. SD76]|uniref:M24 family metallopeptidase n=1 Tax=Arthrobacter sp. SD76 TaxID=3415007 RepID=UPI003C729094